MEKKHHSKFFSLLSDEHALCKTVRKIYKLTIKRDSFFEIIF